MGPYEIEDNHWALLTEALREKMMEAGVSDPAAAFPIMKEWWWVFNDIPALQSYLAGRRLTRLKAERDLEDSKRPALDAEIAALEAQLGV